LMDVQPAVVRFREDFYLMILGARSARLLLLTPDLEVRSIAVNDFVEVIREPLERDGAAEIARTLDEAGIPPAKRGRALRALLDEHRGGRRLEGCWILQRQGNPKMRGVLREAGLLWNGVRLVVAHTGQYLLWLVSWAVLGRLSFSGRMDRGWLWAWVLLLLTMIPFQLMTTWTQGLFAI